VDPFSLKNGESGVSPTLKLQGDLDSENARELGCYEAMFDGASKVTSCKVERKDTAVAVKLMGPNSHSKKPLHEIGVAGVQAFSISRKGVQRTVSFDVLFEKGAELMTAFMMTNPGWSGSVDIDPLQGELFGERNGE
jgi:hypothetical protein